MIPLVRELRKGEARMHAMIGTAGANTCVLIMRRPVAAARRKMLGEALDAKGGAKFIVAECLFEENALTFVVQAKAAGLAKRLKAALLMQTDLRLKVRVRGEDPQDLDEDGEDGGEGPQGEDAGNGLDGPATGVRPPPLVATPEALAYTQRLQKLRGRLEDALRALHPESTKLRAVSAFAAEKAAAGSHAAAIQALQTLEKLLDAPTGPSAAAAVADGEAFNARLAALVPRLKSGPDGARLKASEAGMLARKRDYAGANALLDEAERLLAAPAAASGEPAEQPAGAAASSEGSLVDYATARLAWLDARKRVDAELAGLKSAIAAAYRGSPREKAAQAAARSLDIILRSLDESLADKLDAGRNAPDAQGRAAINKQALDIIARYQGFIYSSPLVREIDSNPFAPVGVQELLVSTLENLERQLV
jgi:hypothetical protein